MVSSLSPRAGEVLLHDAADREWLYFTEPLEIRSAACAAEVPRLLDYAAQRVRREGLYAAGFLSYEAAPAFDAALAVHPDDAFPCAWFGLYAPPRRVALPAGGGPPEPAAPDWQPSLCSAAYQRALAVIKEHIRRGDTYQVNFSYRLRALFDRDPFAFFLKLLRAQACRFGAYVDAGDWVVAGASPELFFSLNAGHAWLRPMKGTAARGLSAAQDRAARRGLLRSAKDRAENVMIVDMARNDLARAAQGVRATRLFRVERYPTVWQMVSDVRGEVRGGVPELLRALFPAASITGAPKPSTMKIIAALEDSPRRVYTGAVGYFGPERAQFNVAIRTVLISRKSAEAEYGVGGGITWDSTSGAERAECGVKARVLFSARPEFELLETLRWTPEEGYFLADLHLARLLSSARYFGFRANAASLKRQFDDFAAGLPPAPHKVRAVLARDGALHFEAARLEAAETLPVRAAPAAAPVDSKDVFLYHKTTQRGVYAAAQAGRPGTEEVILWNEREEVTEGCIANLVYEMDGRLYTPPVECGLLPGTYRAWLLERGELEERVLKLKELSRCTRLWLVNSVRGMRPAELGTV